MVIPADGGEPGSDEGIHLAGVLAEQVQELADGVLRERQSGVENRDEGLFVMLTASGDLDALVLNAEQGERKNHAGVLDVVDLEELIVEPSKFVVKQCRGPVREIVGTVFCKTRRGLARHKLAVNDVPNDRPVHRARVAAGLAYGSPTTVNRIALGAIAAAVDDNGIARSRNLADVLWNGHENILDNIIYYSSNHYRNQCSRINFQGQKAVPGRISDMKKAPEMRETHLRLARNFNLLIFKNSS